MDLDPGGIFRDDSDYDDDFFQEDEKLETHLHVAVNCISQSLQTQIIGRSNDEVSICFFNTVVCGKRAGAFTCLLDETGRYVAVGSLTDDTRPDFNVPALAEIHSLGDPFRITLCSNSRMSKITVKCNDSWNQTANLRAYDWYV